jgi:sulfhydrogenase subunit beta (sulfur reductase)
MQTCVMSRDDLYAFLKSLLEDLPIVGPVERHDQPGFFHFDCLKKADDFATGYVTTTIPPKKAFFQPSETLFTFELDHHPPKMKLVSDLVHFILAGVHPCDLAGLASLDAAYAHPPAEHRWAADRKLATVIGMDCMPDDYCFCASMGDVQSREGCDLFLTPIKKGFLVEVHSDAGQDLLFRARVSLTANDDLNDAEDWRERKRAAMQSHFDEPVERLAEILKAGGLKEVWQEVAERCYSCGSCNTTCPTCFCFDMHDEFDLSLRSGVRRRTWDSCQLLEFALVAGRHNFRGERWQRVRHRWSRKFLYLYERLGRPYCTGCGRCSRACTADINLVDVTNRLFAYARKEGANE